MSDEITRKEVLIVEAVEYGLGDEKFLSKISEDNLENMVKVVKSKNGEIENLKAAKAAPEKNEKVTRVSDLVRGGKIGVAKIEEETDGKSIEEPKPDKGE